MNNKSTPLHRFQYFFQFSIGLPLEVYICRYQVYLKKYMEEGGVEIYHLSQVKVIQISCSSALQIKPSITTPFLQLQALTLHTCSKGLLHLTEHTPNVPHSPAPRTKVQSCRKCCHVLLWLIRAQAMKSFTNSHTACEQKSSKGYLRFADPHRIREVSV